MSRTSASTPAARRDGWTPVTESWSYSSVDGPIGVVTVPTDATTRYQVGDRIKFTNNSAVKYFIVHAVSATTLTLYSGAGTALTNHAISNIFFSRQKAPFGFDARASAWTTSLLSKSTDSLQATPTAGVYYNIGSITFDVPIGSWVLNGTFPLVAQRGSGGTAVVSVLLSTANNDAQDSTSQDLNNRSVGRVVTVTATDTRTMHSPTLLLTFAAKTTLYVVAMANVASHSSIGMIGTASQLYVPFQTVEVTSAWL